MVWMSVKKPSKTGTNLNIISRYETHLSLKIPTFYIILTGIDRKELHTLKLFLKLLGE